MPVNRDEILSVVAQLAEQENMHVTVRESAKGACIVGSSAFAGGVLGGPMGLAVGKLPHNDHLTPVSIRLILLQVECLARSLLSGTDRADTALWLTSSHKT